MASGPAGKSYASRELNRSGAMDPIVNARNRLRTEAPLRTMPIDLRGNVYENQACRMPL